MGYPYNDLIAPAILFKNPGITKEEFVELLNNTHSACYKEYKPNEAWDFYDPKFEDKRYHEGLEGLACILQIDYTPQYEEFQKRKRDENEIFLEPPIIVPTKKEVIDKTGFRFEAYLNPENKIEPVKRRQYSSWNKLGVGDIWEEVMMGNDFGIVTKIYSEKCNLLNGESEEDYEVRFGGPKWEYDMDIKMVNKIFKRERFKDMNAVIKRFPLQDPKNKFNWLQKEGNMYAGLFGKKNFIWAQKDNKYHLDERTFEKMSASFWFNGLAYGYSDFALTLSALKHNAWKILSYKGLRHFPKFMEEFPDVKKDHEKATWNAHTSLYAKKQKMTNYDLLRMRSLYPGIKE